MKRSRALSVVMLAVVGWIFAVGAAAGEQTRTLSVAASEWTPYIDASRPNDGLALDLVSVALRRAGYQPNARIDAWPAAYEAVAAGTYDVVAAVWRTPERERELALSEPYLMNDIIFLCRRGKSVKFEKLADLEGRRIGVVRAFAYGGGFDDYTGARKVANDALIDNLRLLRRGELDLVVGDQWSIFYEIGHFMPDALREFDVLERPLIRRGLRMGVSRRLPEHQQIVADFNRAMIEMNRDGTYRKILQAHTKGIAIIAQGR